MYKGGNSDEIDESIINNTLTAIKLSHQTLGAAKRTVTYRKMA
jgi:hypothetical protein